ncbi:hypothetical protein AB0K00_25365 [Dactylosporangium sp. NPDC049525]|uniref:hypothetical protein n=1 Tax=Dactylosporangium sp. NPDC049525 TaxID=3154730 RepID=UPI00341B6EF0
MSLLVWRVRVVSGLVGLSAVMLGACSDDTVAGPAPYFTPPSTSAAATASPTAAAPAVTAPSACGAAREGYRRWRSFPPPTTTPAMTALTRFELARLVDAAVMFGNELSQSPGGTQQYEALSGAVDRYHRRLDGITAGLTGNTGMSRRDAESVVAAAGDVETAFRAFDAGC